MVGACFGRSLARPGNGDAARPRRPSYGSASAGAHAGALEPAGLSPSSPCWLSGWPHAIGMRGRGCAITRWANPWMTPPAKLFDKCAKMSKLLSSRRPPPSGQIGRAGYGAIRFPRPMLNRARLDFAFPGLKTAVLDAGARAGGRARRTRPRSARRYRRLVPGGGGRHPGRGMPARCARAPQNINHGQRRECQLPICALPWNANSPPSARASTMRARNFVPTTAP